MKSLEFDYAGIYLFYYPHKEENKFYIKVGQAENLKSRLHDHYSSNASLEVYNVFEVKKVNNLKSKLKFNEDKIIKECKELFGYPIKNTLETFEVENIKDLEKIKFFSKQTNKIKFESIDVKYKRNNLYNEEDDIRNDAPPCDFLPGEKAQDKGITDKYGNKTYRTHKMLKNPKKADGEKWGKPKDCYASQKAHSIYLAVKHTLQKENEVNNTLEKFIQ